jgi:hypothetical protein
MSKVVAAERSVDRDHRELAAELSPLAARALQHAQFASNAPRRRQATWVRSKP